MSYYGKLQTLKNGTADAEIQLWAYQQLEKEKTLTDEEISQVYKEISEPFGEKRLYEIHDFARAILKKASEK